MLIKAKTTKVLALPFLNIFVLRYIYEKDKMTIAEKDLMMHSVIAWSKKTFIDELEKRWFEYICSLLDKEEKGKFRQRKENFARHGIDWKKFHQLPQGVYERTIQEISKFN